MNENTKTAEAEPLDTLAAARKYLDEAATRFEELSSNSAYNGAHPALMDAAARIGQGYAQLALVERVERPAVIIVNAPGLEGEQAGEVAKQLEDRLAKAAPGLAGGGADVAE